MPLTGLAKAKLVLFSACTDDISHARLCVGQDSLASLASS